MWNWRHHVVPIGCTLLLRLFGGLLYPRWERLYMWLAIQAYGWTAWLDDRKFQREHPEWRPLR